MTGFGSDRLARRLLDRAHALAVPSIANPDAPPITRLELAHAADIEPDPWQRTILESPAKKHLVLCSRQAGKSTTAALLAAHEALFNPGALVLMLAPALRQSAELFRTTMRIVKRADADVPAVEAESVLRVELANESRIVALPGSESTTRGYPACSMLIIDEAARVTKDLIAAVTPALATTNGATIALTTAWGKSGFFYEQWTEGEGWERTRVVAADCPRISKAYLADQMRLLGPQVFAQEYECEFFDDDRAAFASAMIERAITEDIKPLWIA